MKEKIMIAIHTKYLCPTDTLGARIKASVYRSRDVTFSVTVGYDHAADDAYLIGAQALADKHWPGKVARYVGATLDGNGNVYTLEG